MTFKIELRPFGVEHIAKTFEWVSTPRIQKMFMMRAKPTCSGHIAYWERTLADRTQQVYAIYADSVHVGNCGLRRINKDCGELWIYLGIPFQNHGIGTEATRMLVEKAFQELWIIQVHVAKFNRIAIGMYERLGFKKVEGIGEGWGGRDAIRMELRRQ